MIVKFILSLGVLWMLMSGAQGQCSGTKDYTFQLVAETNGFIFNVNPWTFGRAIYVVHDSSFILWRNDTAVNDSLANFFRKKPDPNLESAKINASEAVGIITGFNHPGVLSAGVVNTDATPVGNIALYEQGLGLLASTLTVDAAHTLVSVIIMIPETPDFFIGLDSVDVCPGTTYDRSAHNASIFTSGASLRMPDTPVLECTRTTDPALPPNATAQILCNNATYPDNCFCADGGPPQIGYMTLIPHVATCNTAERVALTWILDWVGNGFASAPPTNRYGYVATSAGEGTFPLWTIGQNFSVDFADFLMNTNVNNAVLRQRSVQYTIDGFQTAAISGAPGILPTALIGFRNPWVEGQVLNIDGGRHLLDLMVGLRKVPFVPTPSFNHDTNNWNGVAGFSQFDVCPGANMSLFSGSIPFYLIRTGNFTYNDATNALPMIRMNCSDTPLYFDGNQLCSDPVAMTPQMGIVVIAPVDSNVGLCTSTTTRVQNLVVSFEGNWVSSTFGVALPLNAHFSRMVVVTHSSAFSLFQSGSNASVGVQNVAEIGDPTTLLAELETARSTMGTVLSFGVSAAGTLLGEGDGALTVSDIAVDMAHPYVSMIAMLAPSPDWFVGFTMTMCSPGNSGNYDAGKKFAVQAYDAGTDGGASFLSPDMPIPNVPVAPIMCGNGVFCTGSGNTSGIGYASIRSWSIGFTANQPGTCQGSMAYRFSVTNIGFNASFDNGGVTFPANAVLEDLIVVSHTADITNNAIFGGTGDSLANSPVGNWIGSGFGSAASVDALVQYLRGDATAGQFIFDVKVSTAAGIAGGETAGLNILVDETHPKISLAMRVSPSPDWFIATTVPMDACDGATGAFFGAGSVAVSTIDAYDAGLVDGTSFTNGGTGPSTPAGTVAAIGPACGVSNVLCGTGGTVQPDSFISVSTAGALVTSSPPSMFPSMTPTQHPSQTPTKSPSLSPSLNPSMYPSQHPSQHPSMSPSMHPSGSPTSGPSSSPTKAPSQTPSTTPTKSPSMTPSQTPTKTPSSAPTKNPSTTPSVTPTQSPSMTPTKGPSMSPSQTPSMTPSMTPTKGPTSSPSKTPSKGPTATPSMSPTKGPSKSPSRTPTAGPSKSPSATPSRVPSVTPTKRPSADPSATPTSAPSSSPTGSPVASTGYRCFVGLLGVGLSLVWWLLL